MTRTGKHRRPKKRRFTIMWGWWPGRRVRRMERYRATHTNLWSGGELTQEIPIEERDG